MSKVAISIKLNMAQIEQARLFQGAKGQYLDATVFIDIDQFDQYGNSGMVTQDVSKEERANGVKGNILGNVAVFWRDDKQVQKPQKVQPQQQPQQPAPQSYGTPPVQQMAPAPQYQQPAPVQHAPQQQPQYQQPAPVQQQQQNVAPNNQDTQYQQPDNSYQDDIPF
jgi:hypothetical protein